MLFIILVAAAGRRGSRDLIHEARSRNSFRTGSLRRAASASNKIKKNERKKRRKRGVRKRARGREGARCNFVAALSGDDSGSSTSRFFMPASTTKRTPLPFSRMTRITFFSYPPATRLTRTNRPIRSSRFVH